MLYALLTTVGMWAQKDVTSLYITNATLSSLSGWTTACNNTGGEGAPADAFTSTTRGNNTSGYATEAYAGWGKIFMTEYSIKQTITVPAGNYRLVCYAFFRQGDTNDAEHNAKSLASLKAGSNSVSLKTLRSITAAGYANSQAEGANCFDSKMYRNVVEFTSDGSPIEIGVEGTFDEVRSWCIVGQFELFDLDDAASVSSPTDVTYAITNSGFEYRDLSGWTTENDPTTNKTFWYMNNDALSGKAGIGWVESYQSGKIPDGRVIKQELTGLDNGLYEVTVYGHLQQGSGSEGFYLYANDDKVAIGSTDQDYSVTTNVTDGNLTIKLATDGCTGMWAAFDKVRMKFYGDPLPAYQALLDAKVATAQALVDGNTIPNAAETALQTVINDNDNDDHAFTTIDQFTTAISNIETAYNTYKALESPYSAWQKVKDLADDIADLTYVETVSGSHTTFTGAISTQNTAAEASTTAEGLNNASTNLTTAIKTYMSGATLTFVSELDFTCMIENPSFETGSFSGWTNTGMSLQDNASFGKTGTYYAEKWEPNGTFGVSQIIASLPAGSYSISAHAKARAVSSAKVYAGSKETAVTIADSEADYDVEFVSTGSNVTIGFTGTGDGTGTSWLCVDNFTLTYLGYSATPAEKEALADAIADAEAKTLGFESGEYAPYNNVDAIETLAVAQAINPETAPSEAVVAATTALNNATWTANVGEQNAIYNGDFALSNNDGAQVGWQTDHSAGLGGAGHARAFVLNPGDGNYNNLAPFGQGEGKRSCSYFRFDGYNSAKTTKYTYGATAGYTMPLKTGTVYKLTAQAGGWGQVDKNFRVAIVSSTDENVVAQNLKTPSTGLHAGGPAIDYEMYFVVPAAGDYKLVLNNPDDVDNAIVISNIVLKSTEALVFADDAAMPTYAPGTYPSVKITRTLTANKWATAVYPFAVSGVDNIAVLDSYNGETGEISFATAAVSTANEPFLMRSTAGTAEISLSNVAVAATVAEPEVTKSVVSLKGVYASGIVPVSDEDNVRYVVSSNQLYKVDGEVSIKPFRAYFELTGANQLARPTLRFDDVTAINAIEAEETEAGALKDGKYIIDNKVVIVKNGVKYGANGQKLN